MFAAGSGEELARIVARLEGSGALALLVIEAAGPLERIERRYGSEAYQRAMDGIVGLARDLAGEAVPAGDLVVSQLHGEDAILIYLFRPSSDGAFYGSELRHLARRIFVEITRQGKQLVYPYHRDALMLPIGCSVLLHNPAVQSKREIRQAVQRARADAKLEWAIQGRERGDQLMQIIMNRELRVRFESVVDLRRSEVLGYEALARGPEGTLLHTPGQLFQLAAEQGLLYELDVLCRRLALQNSRVIPRGKKLFLNVLPTSFGDPNLRAEGLRKALEDFPLRPNDLVLEISEKESIENFTTFREMRDACRSLGIQVAVDDAGAGHASLEAIMEISPDFLKADMALVRGVDADPARQEILKSLNAVAKRIGAVVVAEGIETEAELRAVREIGIRYGQGFHFGSPLVARPETPPS
jgi:EAL domain-containing protein (putative c-di-GMP-specific phosphodiesterase class I)